jgi:Phage baseplate assembly protein W
MDNKQVQNFIGQGITLPLKLVNGKPPLESGFELIRSSIITILAWNYGNRFFLGEFGSKLSLLLEEPNDDILQETIKVFVIDAISQWDTRIELIDTQVERPNDYSINLTVKYQILSTKREDTFTFPFYRKITY